MKNKLLRIVQKLFYKKEKNNKQRVISSVCEHEYEFIPDEVRCDDVGEIKCIKCGELW